MLKARSLRLLAGLSSLSLLLTYPGPAAYSQTPASVSAPTTAATPAEAPDLLSEDELEILVARIALYPDELVAAISAASLFPLQIVEAERFLEAKAEKSDLKPKAEWDGSVISLLNYPDIVKMMSEDLDWTQSLADALTNQQKDVLIAIQQLRDEAVAKNIIKTDDKVTVVTENENIVIRPTNPEKVYIPQYPPEMLYEDNYQSAPISYYPNSYESYYYPGAAFFAGAITGAAWGAIVNWDDWGVWGGDWGGDVDIDCNNCFNDRDFNGKIKLKDVDWSKVDRSKLNIGRDQINNLDRSAIKSGLQADNRNQLKNKIGEGQGRGPSNRDVGPRAQDIRKSTAEGLKAGPKSKAGSAAANRPNAGARPETRPAAGSNRPTAGGNRPAAGSNRPAAKTNKKAGAPKMAARPDNRPRQPSALGNVQSGRREAVASQRGGQSMGGGQRGRQSMGGAARGGSHAARTIPRPHGGGGGGRGGGGRGGGGGRR